MADVFVARDTVGLSAFFNKVVQKGLIYKYAFRYTDRQREALMRLQTVEDLLAYIDEKEVWSDFMNMVGENGITPDKKDVKESKRVILVQILAYIARNVMDNEGYYPVVREIDNTLKRAVDVAMLPVEEFNALLQVKPE